MCARIQVLQMFEVRICARIQVLQMFEVRICARIQVLQMFEVRMCARIQVLQMFEVRTNYKYFYKKVLFFMSVFVRRLHSASPSSAGVCMYHGGSLSLD
jgi:hypothetical protein